MTRASLNVGLIGLGTVGSQVAERLLNWQTQLSRRAGIELCLSRILVRDASKARTVKVDRGLVTADPGAVIDDPSIHVVVEVAGGDEPMHGYLERAIRAGKHVITANKMVMAQHGPELLDLAAEKNVDVYFEAAVGGGIPLIAPLTDDLAANRILELRAIINGTTNYILTRMAEGSTFESALAQAQKLGYAEADPADDVDAVDAADKLAILVRIAFGLPCTPAQIFRQGVRGLDPQDLAYGREMGYALKLLATARRTDGKVEARVHPTFLSAEHPLARVDGPRNAVHVVGDLSGPVLFGGLGAGGDATASAVLADVMHVARRLTLGDPVEPPRPLVAGTELLPMGEVRTRCYLRLAVDDVPGVFAQVTHVLAERGIGLASVIQREPGRGPADVVLLTYAAAEGALAQAEAELSRLPCTRAVRARIRVEEART